MGNTANQVYKSLYKESKKRTTETVVKEEYSTETIYLTKSSLSGRVIPVEIYGQTPDRSYEDRDVYFRFGEDSSPIWMPAEEAIEFGMKLIEHGKRALVANMVGHQAIHKTQNLFSWIDDGLVEKLLFIVIDEKPANYGGGFRTYLIVPVWKPGRAPKYCEDFTFEKVIYWPPTEEDYTKALAAWKVPIEFRGYDREAEVEEFNRAVKRDALIE